MQQRWGRMKGFQKRSFKVERTQLREWIEAVDFQRIGALSKENRTTGLTTSAVTFPKSKKSSHFTVPTQEDLGCPMWV